MPACRSCGGDIFWCVTENQRRMPVDREPRVDGNLAIIGNRDGAPMVKYVDVRVGAPERYVSHFATCGDADEWRST